MQKSYSSPQILILDEIDTIIHPTILEDFIEILRKVTENIQVFITTHSPYFLDSFEKNEIYFLKDNSAMHARSEDLSNRYNISSYQDIFDNLPTDQQKFFSGKKHSELLINGTIEGLFPAKKSND
jgi:predicted ATP-binding protein involved in virulence